MDGVIQGLWLLGFRLYGFRAWGSGLRGLRIGSREKGFYDFGFQALEG